MNSSCNAKIMGTLCDMLQKIHTHADRVLMLIRLGQKRTGPTKSAEPNRAVRFSVLVSIGTNSVPCFIPKKSKMSVGSQFKVFFIETDRTEPAQ